MNRLTASAKMASLATRAKSRSGAILDKVHLIRSGAALSRCRHGVGAKFTGRAGYVNRSDRPQFRATARSHDLFGGYPAVATVAGSLAGWLS